MIRDVGNIELCELLDVEPKAQCKVCLSYWDVNGGEQEICPVHHKFRKNMFDIGRTEQICREMDKLAKEDHTHRITEDEIRVYRNNWWIRSNTVGSDTMPVRHRADFKEALSTLATAQEPRGIQLTTKSGKALPHLGGNWQESWWHSSSEYHRDAGPGTD